MGNIPSIEINFNFVPVVQEEMPFKEKGYVRR